MLATLGIAALAALGAPGLDGMAEDAALCSVHPAMIAELEAALSPASFSPRSAAQPLCTEQDSADDPRCHAQSQGQRPGAPRTPQRTASPDALPAAAPRLVVHGTAPPGPTDTTRCPPSRTPSPLRRPPRS